MLEVSLTDAKPGMVLALPVRNPQSPDRCLLAAGYELGRRDIERLRELGVHYVLVRYPGLEALERFINPQVLERRAGLAHQLQHTFGQVQERSHAKVPYEQYVRQMAALVEELLRNPSAALFLDRARTDNPWLMQHSCDVAYLCLLMGLKLEDYLIRQRSKLSAHYAREVCNLGVGAMLHDIGLLHLDPQVLRRFAETHDDADPAWRAHVRLGYDLVRGQIEPSAAVIVLNHHQHYDGSGFPSRRELDGRPSTQAGARIHVFARITTVADTFAEIRHPYEGEPIPTVRALRRLLDKPYIDWCDPEALRAFMLVTPPYAPTRPVMLNDGRWAVPIDYSPAAPCRPRVQIIDDPKQQQDGSADRPERGGPLVDLRQHPELRIVEAEGEEVAEDNFEPPNFYQLSERNAARATAG